MERHVYTHTHTHSAVGTTYTAGNSLKQKRKSNEKFHKQAQALFLQTTRCHCASGFVARHVTLQNRSHFKFSWPSIDQGTGVNSVIFALVKGSNAAGAEEAGLPTG